MENIMYFYLHNLITLGLASLLLLCPLKYYKYIAFIPFLISLHWIYFNGCILDNLHHKDCNINKEKTDNITPFIGLFNKDLSEKIYNNYLKNTSRPTYILISKDFLILTIIIYRLIYKIEFFNTETNENI